MAGRSLRLRLLLLAKTFEDRGIRGNDRTRGGLADQIRARLPGSRRIRLLAVLAGAGLWLQPRAWRQRHGGSGRPRSSGSGGRSGSLRKAGLHNARTRQIHRHRRTGAGREDLARFWSGRRGSGRTGRFRRSDGRPRRGGSGLLLASNRRRERRSRTRRKGRAKRGPDGRGMFFGGRRRGSRRSFDGSGRHHGCFGNGSRRGMFHGFDRRPRRVVLTRLLVPRRTLENLVLEPLNSAFVTNCHF